MKAFLFPGQGSQKLKMGLDLYKNFTEAREVFEQVDSAISKKISSIIFGDNSDLLNKTENTQVAIFTISMAILAIIKKQTNKNINELCSMVAGHSLGEYSALTATDSLDIETTARILDIRGKAMAQAGSENPGSMMAILGLDEKQISNICKLASTESIFCSIANDNCPGQIVISGHKQAIEKAKLLAEETGAKKCMILPVSIAAHSKLMETAKDIIQDTLKNITIKTPNVSFISNNTAKIENNTENIKQQLSLQMISGVRFRESIDFMIKNNIDEFIEIGNGNILTGLVKRCNKDVKTTSVSNTEQIDNFLTNL